MPCSSNIAQSRVGVPNLKRYGVAHVMPAIDDNNGHLSSTCCFGTESDTVAAFPIYRTKDGLCGRRRTSPTWESPGRCWSMIPS